MQRPVASHAVKHKDFLKGLMSFINALRRLQKMHHPKLTPALQAYNKEIIRNHLPGGLCKGFALSMAHIVKTQETIDFGAQHRLISQFARSSNSDVENYILQNPHIALSQLEYFNQLLAYHYSGTSYQKVGYANEIAITVNLRPSDLADVIRDHVLAFTPQREDQPHQRGYLTISNGEHMIGIAVRFWFGKIQYRLNDANDTFPEKNDWISFETNNLNSLCERINARFSILNRYDGECTSYIINVLTTIPDPAFDTILQKLKQDANSNTPYQAMLIKLLNNYEKGQSKIGFLEDVLLYFSEESFTPRKIPAQLAPFDAEIRAYLSRHPNFSRMRFVIEKYKNNINSPSSTGYSWLHMAALTNEKYVFWKLLNDQRYLANPNLKPRPKTISTSSVESDEAMSVRGMEAKPKPINADEDCRIIESNFACPNILDAIRDDEDLMMMIPKSPSSMIPESESVNGELVKLMNGFSSFFKIKDEHTTNPQHLFKH